MPLKILLKFVAEYPHFGVCRLMRECNKIILPPGKIKILCNEEKLILPDKIIQDLTKTQQIDVAQ